MAVDEERELSEAYRITKRVRRPEGQGTERSLCALFPHGRAAHCEDGPRRGVLHFQLFLARRAVVLRGCGNAIWRRSTRYGIDCLNGDKYKTGKVAPDGSPDPSIFSTEGDPVGIQVGTAIATLVRKADHASTEEGWLFGICGDRPSARN